MIGSDVAAYSYLRFSSLPQEEGDSLRRQRELTRQWAQRKGVRLDESLEVDRGKSGYDGSNVENGALGQFVRLVNRGKVKRGSYLVVEALDRLTRAHPQDALRLLLALTGAGIVLVQLEPEEVEFTDKSDAWELMRFLMNAERGHGESKRKSGMLRKQRQGARKAARQKVLINQHHPTWLARRGCGCKTCVAIPDLPEKGWYIIEERAEVVRRIFRLAASGYGTQAIVQALRKDHVPTFRGQGQWRRGTVLRLLRDGQACGRFTPKGPGGELDPDGPIEDYYPRLIDPTLEAKALAGMRSRRRYFGRLGKMVNVFSGLLFDAGGGGGALNMVREKGVRESYAALKRDKHESSDVPRLSLPYLPFERAILSRLEELPDDLMDDDQADDQLGAARRAVEVLEARQARLIDMLSRGGSDTLERTARKIDADLSAARERLAEAEDAAALNRADELTTAKDIIARLDGAEDQRDERLRLRAALRAFVQAGYVVMVKDGTSKRVAVQLVFSGGRRRDYLIVWRRARAGRNYARVAPMLAVGSFPHNERSRGRMDFTSAYHVEVVRELLTGLDVSSLPLTALPGE